MFEPMTWEEEAENDARLYAAWLRRRKAEEAAEERETGRPSPYWGLDDDDDGEED